MVEPVVMAGLYGAGGVKVQRQRVTEMPPFSRISLTHRPQTRKSRPSGHIDQAQDSLFFGHPALEGVRQSARVRALARFSLG